jgi:hypothetical protein
MAQVLQYLRQLEELSEAVRDLVEGPAGCREGRDLP